MVQTIPLNSMFNLKLLPLCHSTVGNAHSTCLLFSFLCNIIPSVLLIFFLKLPLRDILSNCFCCIWGGSASSRTQTGCEVLCLLGFLCDWPQCLPTQSSHSTGDSKKTGRGDLHVHHMYMLLMRSSSGQKKHVQKRVPGVTPLLCNLEWSAVRQECKRRSFKAIHFPFDPPDPVLYRR